MSACPELPTGAELHLVDLVSRVAAGDEDAFGELYGLAGGHVERVAVRTLRAPDLAADVVQEVFLHVWQHAATFDPARGGVLTWLAMHAHRRAVDRVRASVRSARRDQQDVDRSATVADDVAEVALRRCEVAELRTAMSRITPLQREAVTLTHLQGFTYLEVAELLRLPLGTVKSRVFEGVAHLRRLALPLSA